MKQLFSIKKDKYKRVRGNYTRLIEIHCYKCGNLIVIYQKDGAGTLIRMYMDRIFFPKKLVNLQKRKLADIPFIKCKKCGRMIAAPYIYGKEKRKAFGVFQGTIKKKIIESKR